MVPSLRNLPYEERISRLKLPILKKRKKSRDIIAVYRASKGLEIVDRDDLFVWDDRRREHEKKLKRTTCKRYLEWTEERGDNGKECTSTEGKIRHIDTETGTHKCSSVPVY